MKKLICMVLVVAMALSMGITSAFADDPAGSATVALKGTTGYAGSTVSVKVDLGTNDGLYGMLLPITYDQTKLSLTSFSSGAFTRWSVGVKKDSAGNEIGSANAVWDNSSETDNTAHDTTILTLNFTVLSGATGTAAVSIGGEKTEAYNYNLKDITLQDADGAAIKETAVEGTVTINSAPSELSYQWRDTLMCDDNVKVRYYIYDTNFTVDSNTMLLVWKSDNIPADGQYIKDTESYAISGFTAQKIGGVQYYYINAKGTPAAEMGDTMYARVCVKTSTGYVYGPLDTGYSPLQYCINQGKNTATSAAVNNLCKSMMEYGSMAQIQFNHNKDNLMIDVYNEAIAG